MSYESVTNSLIKSNINVDVPDIDQRNREILVKLESNSIDEKNGALLSVISLIEKKENILLFIPKVLSCMINFNEATSNLVSYIISCIPDNSEIVILFAGTLMRLIHDSELSCRITGLKLLTSLKDEALVRIAFDVIKKHIGDMFPFIRRECAISLVKMFKTGLIEIEEIKSLLIRLLNDQSVIVIGGAIYAYSIIFPDNDEIIHPFFRVMCKALSKLDPWSQAVLLRVLSRYVRRNFVSPSSNFDNWGEEQNVIIDPDFELLLSSVQPLLSSLDPFVVIEACSLFLYCAPEHKIVLIVKPLIRIIYEDSELANIALSAISSLVVTNPEPFVPYLKHFFPLDSDYRNTKLLKIKIMSLLSRPSNCIFILDELSYYVLGRDIEFSSCVIIAMGRAISRSGMFTFKFFGYIIRLLSSPFEHVSSQAIHVLSTLLRPLPEQLENVNMFSEDAEKMDETDVAFILKKLMSFFGKIDNSDAKSSLIALIGDKSEIVPLQAHEILRQLAITFPHQSIDVKIQTINLAAKVYVLRPDESQDLVRFVFTQAIYDTNIDLRDKVRLLYQLLVAKTDHSEIIEFRKLSKTFIFPKKLVVDWDKDSVSALRIELGSISQFLGKLISSQSDVFSYRDDVEMPNPSIRSVKEDIVEEEKDENSDSLNDYFQ